MATLADLQAKTDAANAALDAGNWAAAKRLCDQALLIIATMPDTQFDGTDQIRFDRQGATMAIQAIKRSANSHGWKSGSASEEIQYRRG
jgi:hypothetical protein